MKARKIPALLVALCMLISLLPAVPVTTAEAADVTQTIEFTHAGSDVGLKFNDASYIGLDKTDWQLNQNDSHYYLLDNSNTVVYRKGTFSKITSVATTYIALDFNVKQSGYYDIDFVTKEYGTSGSVTTMIDGTAMNPVANVSSVTDGSELPTRLGSKYLSQGTHTIILTLTSDSQTFIFKSLQLSLRNDMPEQKNQTIVFGHGNKHDSVSSSNKLGYVGTNSVYPRRVSIANSGWEIDKANTNIDFYNSMDKGDNVLNADHSKVIATASWYIGYKFVVDASGYYDLSAKILQGTLGANVTATIDGADIGTLTGNKADDSYPAAVLPLRKGVYLTAGEHVLKLTFTTSGRFWLYDLYLTAGEPVAETIALPFGSTDSGIDKSNVNSATLDNYKWALASTNTVDLSSSSCDIYGDNINAKVYENELLAFKFNAEVAGDYELVLNLGEHCDYGGNMQVFVNGEAAGYIYGDDNTSAAGSNGTFNKGFGKVTLNKGENTIGFKGLAPDIVDGPYVKENQVGDVHLYLYNATFTPVDDVVVKGVEITCNDTELEVNDNVSVTAKVAMSDGSYDATKAATALNMTEDIISYDAATGNVKALKAGTGLIEFTYTADNGVVYEKQIRIRVKNSNSVIFGTSYAYVREDASGSYTISLIGALDSIGFKAAGFEVWGNENRVADAQTTQVYKTVTTKDGVKTPVTYGSTEDGYIFFSTASGLKAGTTYTVKPYVIDENDNKIYHNDLTLVIQ